MGTLPDILKTIALNNKLAESRELASIVQTSLVRRLSVQNKTIRDLGVKQAPFVVLIGAQMPSVLAEISFLTNHARRHAAEAVRLPPEDRAGALRRHREIPGVAEEGHDGRVEGRAAVDWTLDSRSDGDPSRVAGHRPFIVIPIPAPSHQASLADVVLGAVGLTGVLIAASLLLGVAFAVGLIAVEPAASAGRRSAPADQPAGAGSTPARVIASSMSRRTATPVGPLG